MDHADARRHRHRMPLAICLAVAVVASIVMLAYPIPQIRGG